MWVKYFQMPDFALTWKTDNVTLTDSGDIAVATGKWRNGAHAGPFLIVWRKQPDGKWKVLVDSSWLR